MTARSRPAAEGVPPGHFPGPPVVAGHVAPCPRRIVARDAGGCVLDTVEAFYVWEHPFYPQYAVPGDGLPPRLRESARSVPDDPRLEGYVLLHLEQDLQWYEEGERVHLHPRNPYVRVDALRTHRLVTVRLPADAGPARELARTTAPVGVFETSLPPRWYLDPECVDWSLLTRSDTISRCPYKGVASDYWSAGAIADVAWSYPAPTPALQAIAGLVCFDDTAVEVEVTPAAPGQR